LGRDGFVPSAFKPSLIARFDTQNLSKCSHFALERAKSATYSQRALTEPPLRRRELRCICPLEVRFPSMFHQVRDCSEFTLSALSALEAASCCNRHECRIRAYSVEKLPCQKKPATIWNNCFADVRLVNGILRMAPYRDRVPLKCTQLAKHRVFQQNRLEPAIRRDHHQRQQCAVFDLP